MELGPPNPARQQGAFLEEYKERAMTLLNTQGNFLLGGDIALATRKNTSIPNTRRKPQAPVSMQAAQAMVLGEHPSAKVRSLSSVYNCMGMVFASRRTWVEPDYLQMILEDDEYRPIDRNELHRGDVVVYRNNHDEISHVGIVYEVRLKVDEATLEVVAEVVVASQWGHDGEYFHLDDDVNPRLGKPTEYWTDRT